MKFILVVAIGLGNPGYEQVDQLVMQEFGSERSCVAAADFINATATRNIVENPNPAYVSLPTAMCVPYK